MTSLVLYRWANGPIIWRLDDLDYHTAKGIMETIFYKLRHDPFTLDYVIELVPTDDPKSRYTYRDWEQGYLFGVPDYKLQNAMETTGKDTFVLMFRPIKKDNMYIVRYFYDYTRLLSYLQGVLTVANHYNMNINEILAELPYRDGVYYNIN